MATGSQLRRHAELKAEYRSNVASIERIRDQSLTLAQIQLAVVATNEVQRGEPLDVTLRKGFDPELPSEVLTPSEFANLGGAQLVISALKQHIEASDHLANKHGPVGTIPGTF
jgi:hypothetical protein